MDKRNLIVAEGESGKRLDVYLVKHYQKLSRSHIQKLIKKNYVKVNKELKKPNYIVRPGDKIEINLPKIKDLTIKPENIQIDIIYEDDDIIVVNKQQGIVVHPTTDRLSGTLVNGLLYYCGSDLSNINGMMRPGIVHRIDKNTSGLLVVAKNNNSHKILAEQFKRHTVIRQYHTIVSGTINETNAVIDAPIGRNPTNRIKRSVISGGKNAITHFRVLKRFKGYTYVEARLETGRTHQIRVHFSYIGKPILGDPMYGYKDSKFKLVGQALHAKALGFIHPTRNKYVKFISDLPQYFIELIDILENRYSID